jgi:sterol desaturase/sphingolipid hydroxylase (fatty acid hydroxylase superfamily)
MTMNDYTPLLLLSEPGSFWAPALLLAGISAVRYGVFAGIAWGLGYRAGVAERHHKLQPAMPAAAQVGREVGYAAATVLIFGAVYGMLVLLGAMPRTQLYVDVARHGWAWLVLSIVVALVVHDAYFYWTHRLLHVRAIFRHVHRVHHLSTNPTPWTAYAFHPAEAFVQAGAVVLIVFTVPMHPLALIAFQMISTAINVYGHCGYELYPPGWSRHPLGRWINTSVAHNTHHARAQHNYGLYLLAWDRWMDTLDPAYERRYDAARPSRDATFPDRAAR